jgi:hypothetical protein
MLLETDIIGSPYDIEVFPGEISSTKSFTSISDEDLQELEAGSTYLFTVYLVDIYSNALTNGDQQIEILAEYEDHSEWPSPIDIPDLYNWQALYGANIAGITTKNQDGSYQGQLTLYRAGTFQLYVKINRQHVIDSPWT